MKVLDVILLIVTLSRREKGPVAGVVLLHIQRIHCRR
jgi:hypothetical protein